MPDGSKQVTAAVVGQAPDVDQSLWHVSSALHDLCMLLADTRVRTITLRQLKDLDIVIQQAKRARAIAGKIDLPIHEFNS